MSDVEDDIYFDAISTGGPVTGQNKGGTCTVQSATGDSHDCSNAGSKVKHNQKVQKGQGRVLQLASQFTGQTKIDKTTADANAFLHKIHDLQSPTVPVNRQATEEQPKAFIVTEPSGETFPSAYSFAAPFSEDAGENGSSGQFHAVPASEGQGQTAGDGQNRAEGPDSFIDSIGYSHPNKTVGKEDISNKTNEFPVREQQSAVDNTTSTHDQICTQNLRASPVDLHVGHNITQTEDLEETVFENNFEHIDEENIYDSVHNSLDSRSGPVSGDFEVIHHEHVAISGPIPGSSPKRKTAHGKTAEKRQMKLMASEMKSYEWKRKEAKKKSKALKRTTKSDKEGNPFTKHSQFDDPHRGAIPEAENETVGHFNPFNLDGHHESDSGSSCFTDSTFDSTSSDSDQDEDSFFTDKPLPPKPKKDHQLRDLAHKVLPGHQRKESDDGTPILEKVVYRRPRSPPMLPDSTGIVTQNQIKLRGVLQSLIDSERNYIASLERLTNGYKEQILSHVKKPEVKVTFQKVEEIMSIHKMFQIEFTDKLKKWNTDEQIGSIFHVFSQKMVVDIYSDYVNNYEAASELIREVENSKQSFKEFLKKKQMESVDRLSLSGLMLKPVQRFPQFIMIIKDLLKYSPRDHHDREPLQEAVTWIENVAHQLNERKRQSEQFFHGQQIMNKLTPRIHPEKNVFLIRQDDMEQLSQDATGSHYVKQRRIFLMNDRLVSVHVSHRDQDAMNSERYTYKWHQSLRELDLTTSAITPNMQTTVNIGQTSSTILSPKTERSEEDPYDVASELTDMMHDISVLAKINQMVSTLKLAYHGLTEDKLHGIITKLQKDIQSKDYQLQMLNSSSIILQDKIRKRKYVFSASSASVKQEWCIDFLLAKYAVDIVNIPSWHKQDSKDSIQPALLMKHMSVDMQRTFTRVSCGVKIYFPKKNEDSMEHLWICSSTEGHGQVSVVSLHTDKPSLLESFQATKCMVISVECVPGYAMVKKKAAFEEDTVWMSTADSEIQVFMLSEKQADFHRRCLHIFEVGCIVLCMKYIDDLVFCGARNGSVIVFSRNDDGVWSVARRVTLDINPVTSLICVGDNMWAACGNSIYIIDIDSHNLEGKVEHQLAQTGDHDVRFEYLVKTGVGVWASFIGQPNICLYHSESRRLLQDFNINTAVHEFIKVYSSGEERKNFQVSCLLASLGLLWVGTNVGIILAYPLPRLRDGVPRINERPQVALHSHSGPVKFLLPVHYGPVTGAPIRRRMESVLKKYKVDESVIKKLSIVEERESDSRPNSYVSLDAVAMAADNIYEAVDFQGYHRDTDSQIYSEIPNQENGAEQNPQEKLRGEGTQTVKGGDDKESELYKSDEHKYFILEPQANDGDKTVKPLGETGKTEENKANDDEHVVMRPKSEAMAIDRKSSENLDIHRRSMTTSFDERYDRQPSAFQLELKNKLKHRQSLEDLTDRAAATQDEVSNLYPTLLRPKTLANPNKNLQESFLSSSLPDVSDIKKESFYRRPRMSTPIIARRPNFSSTKSLSKESKKKDKKSPKSDSPQKEKRRSVSFNKDDTMEKKRKSTVGSSFSQGSSVDTLRKQDTNTIMVISAGDGYKDWKKRQSLPNYRPEEPCLMFWMYKF